VSVAVPLAATEKLAALPAVTELALGCVVIAGAVAAAVTAKVAALLVADPTLLVTTTV
jgi:hypothetical protein